MHKRLINIILLTFLFSVSYAHHTTDDIDAFNQTWVAKVMKLEREIDKNVALNRARFIGTHNSYNSHAYTSIVSYLDPNQELSIYNQLEMGMRSIELDAHWTTTESFTKSILLCHGKDNHFGCSPFDRPISDGLKEIRKWLDEHPNEVILLYIEQHLDGHEPMLATELDKYLGSYIYHSSELKQPHDDPNACISLPAATVSKSDILKAGKQVIIVTKGCVTPPYADSATEIGVWNNTVFAGIGQAETLHFTFIDSLIDGFTDYPDCGSTTLFRDDSQHSSIWRIYEDRTHLSHITHPHTVLNTDNVHELARCNINWIGFDMLSPSDDRLLSTIWSWAPSYPQDNSGDCALYQTGTGIINSDCQATLESYTCQQETTHQLTVVEHAGSWSSGEDICRQYAGEQWHFATPVNAGEMTELRSIMTNKHLTSTWLNYSRDNQDNWLPNQLAG